ncbi:glycoside hydrolase family 13 protein [Mangrovimonas sp. AS39]|uniref:glycoside hydrolase family 13 protein n=1 Tax=Mangrovimonas futianensis TaxID=2895523 RepID=UPI001E467C24|nr:glycoside hydrolase family 13 protein [Mangrovimonas futianensis]MCF1190929.1 glycoside hydrolase family 13 protein [Mangrovimonas futianensis]MCF1194625.1 glycoside hydrolase family 13 protein [Mangrovimonas futianensis]
MKKIFVVFFLVIGIQGYAQIDRVEPPNWWVGFQDTSLQLLVKDSNIGDYVPKINYPGITITKVHQAKSPNYLFIDLEIDKSTKPGTFQIELTSKKHKTKKVSYELKSREKAAADFIGFDNSDAIYLITPDRFANGDSTNDINKDLKEKTIDRGNDYGRHGGDLRGIINHLDYIHDMGFTAIWPTPMLTNDMPRSSYHGYAITDFYEVDPRFGTLEEYKELSQEMSERGLKLIMDMVANHCGSEHWWMKDLPFSDWVNQQQAFENHEPLNNSNHFRTTNQDLYASESDKKGMSEGWFVSSMPDLNQRNPFMAKYIIQNNIWWIETLQLNGIRQDTYPYPDKAFMSDWAGAIMKEYPNFKIVGEEWSVNPLLVRYWQQGTPNKQGYESHLSSSMDFPMQETLVKALNQEESWGTGLKILYEGLANDFAYTKPEDIMIFPDNHDMDRIFTQLKEDVPNTKMALAYLLTIPRIVQVYYGTEVLIQNTAKPHDHGLIRTDFPGGWDGDSRNGFTGEGMTTSQKEMQGFLKKVLNYRKTSDAIQKGKTIHFGPFNGTYFLFRQHGDETVVCILNKNEASMTIDLKRYSEMGLTDKELTNIVTGETIKWSDSIQLNQRGVVLLTTKI